MSNFRCELLTNRSTSVNWYYIWTEWISLIITHECSASLKSGINMPCKTIRLIIFLSLIPSPSMLYEEAMMSRAICAKLGFYLRPESQYNDWYSPQSEKRAHGFSMNRLSTNYVYLTVQSNITLKIRQQLVKFIIKPFLPILARRPPNNYRIIFSYHWNTIGTRNYNYFGSTLRYWSWHRWSRTNTILSTQHLNIFQNLFHFSLTFSFLLAKNAHGRTLHVNFSLCFEKLK